MRKFMGLYELSGSRSQASTTLQFAGDARNIISVAQLAYDHGLVTVFEPTRCHVKNKESGKIVGKGLLRNGIYVLEYLLTSQVRTYTAIYIYVTLLTMVCSTNNSMRS